MLIVRKTNRTLVSISRLPGHIKKPVPLIRIRQHAGVVFSKDVITIARDEAIDNISQRARDNASDPRKNVPGHS